MEKKCNGAHCRCMNIGGQCSNMHYAECRVHNPMLTINDEVLKNGLVASGVEFTTEDLPTIDKSANKILDVLEAKFEEWYEANKPPEGAYTGIRLEGLKTFARHAYFVGIKIGLNKS